MLLIKTFLVVAGIVASPPHDLAMAVFRVEPTENGFTVGINFDQEDYALVNKLVAKQIDRYSFQEYLDCSTNWIINGTQQRLVVTEISEEGDHLQAKCAIEMSTEKLKSMVITNDFLLPIEDQTNVVLLAIDGNTRGFRMHSGRREITVEY